MPEVSLTDLEGKPHAFRNGASDLALDRILEYQLRPMPGGDAATEKALRPTASRTLQYRRRDQRRSLDTLRKYLAEFSIAWPECREPDTGPVHQIMRIEGIPAYFLIAKDGEDLFNQWVGSGNSGKRIETALDSLPKNR